GGGEHTGDDHMQRLDRDHVALARGSLADAEEAPEHRAQDLQKAGRPGRGFVVARRGIGVAWDHRQSGRLGPWQPYHGRWFHSLPASTRRRCAYRRVQRLDAVTKERRTTR